MRYLLSVSLALGFLSASSQKVWLDVYAGATNYQGDLQDKRYTFDQAHLAGGAGVTYDLNDHFAAKFQILFGALSANDKFGRNKARNLNFKTSLFETQLGLKYYLIPLNSRIYTPYLFASVALFHFNPYTYDTTNAKYFLRPLSTEGEGFIQGKKMYALTQVSIPFGGGIKFSVSDHINVGLELGLRKTFTDYIDDVSTTYVDQAQLLAARGPKAVELAYRGNELPGGAPYPAAGTERGGAKSLDWYYFTAFTFSYRISHNSRDTRSFSCPPSVR